MIIEWVLLTLGIVSITAVLARKQGPEIAIGMFAAMAVTANVLASKIVVFLWWEVDAGTIVYASMFLLTDMLSEFYGKKAAYKAVWAGFLSNIVLVASVWIAVNWQPAPSWQLQQEFAAVFANTGRIVLASMAAYLVSQNHDIWAYGFWKRVTRGKYLWLRNNASTLVSQMLDSAIFVTIAFWGIYPVWNMIIGLFAAKALIAVMDTPFLYTVRYFFRR